MPHILTFKQTLLMLSKLCFEKKCLQAHNYLICAMDPFMTEIRTECVRRYVTDADVRVSTVL
jgi:hypothetical protein